MSADARRVKELFGAALECPDAAARAAFLDRECGDDAELRRRLEQLLFAHDHPESALERPLGAPAETLPYTGPTESAGAVIAGRYKLLERLGEGGMGEVWVADQLEPIKRRVAIKLIKPGMDSRAVLARFEAERQALALMDHPNIARVLDASATDDGRPYFVMELVKGTPITQFCDERKLSTRERLELFVPVCQAIQHAHQKGIIHRDVKPSNVLVALHDEKPVPKVIDFGVAKAIGQQLTEKTLYTNFGTLVGTPAYMAPEQATFNQLDIDTRADIYSLGVLLYELLAGSPPFEPERLKKAALDEVLRLVREEEPPRPSARLSTAETRASIAAVRQTEPAKLTKLLRGELDWVVMKALEKERNRRYETANGFAMDVQRYLAGEAVEAVPPSAGYRLRKFVRRNKAGVAAVAAAMLATVTAVAGLAAGNVLIMREKNQTAAALAQSRENEKAYQEQLRRADENLRLTIQRGGATVIDWGLFHLYPNQVFHQYLLPEEANALRQSLQIYRAFLAINHDSRSASLGVSQAEERLALLHLAFGEYRAAEETMRAAIVRLEELAEADRTAAEYRWVLVDDYQNLGEALELQGRQVEAERLYRHALRLATDLLDRWDNFTFVTREEVHNSLAWGAVFLGYLLHRTGRSAEAEAMFGQALRFAERQGFETVIPLPKGVTIEHVKATDGLGRVFQSTGRLKEAEDAYREVVGIWEKTAAAAPGNRHYQWHVAVAAQQLSEFHQATGRGKEAGAESQRALKIWEDLTAQYATVPAYRRELAWFLAFGPIPELRDPARAATLAGKATELASTDGLNWVTLAAARYRTGNWTEAQAALEKGMTLRPWGEGIDWFLQALIRARAGDTVGARQWYDRAVAWTAKNDVYNPDLHRLQVEAAQLLDLTKK